MKRIILVAGALSVVGAAWAAYPYRPADITKVAVTGGFWLPRVETNRLVTVWTDLGKCELARIPNFTNAAIRAWGTFRGIPFDDSDVYKVIEGAAYTLATHPDPKLEAYLDRLIAQIARAQEPDGYLYTARTLGFTYKDKNTGAPTFGMMGPTRWSSCPSSHELYNAGHMYEAAVAYWRATGKRTLLDVAIRSADLVDRTFGPGPTQLKDVPGHEEIELALVKLAEATGEARYLKLARHFLDQRGTGMRNRKAPGASSQSDDPWKAGEMGAPGASLQKHRPVVDQREAVGHAVRAGYLYCAMTDIAAVMGDAAYATASEALWRNVVEKKLHLNGGIGARHKGEAFGAAYELPNASAYLETCAAIANALWNQRLFQLTGEAKYADVLERVLYNGFLSGISIGGDEFFYPNPLASGGGYARSKWFGCSCCPVNVLRFIPQIASFAYATHGNAAYVNLFVESTAKLTLAGGTLTVAQETAYPWKGASTLKVTPSRAGLPAALHVRVPGWCVGRPVPSSLYEQVVPGKPADFTVTVNGAPYAFTPEKGYCVIDRAWQAGDVVRVSMNMPVRRIRAAAAVADDRGCLAVERGPILYCAEGVDNAGSVLDLVLPETTVFSDATRTIASTEFPALVAECRRCCRGLRTYGEAPASVCLVPYFAWCHRGAGEMQVWFPTTAAASKTAGFATTWSHANSGVARDTPRALSDGVLPSGKLDWRISRFTFWPHKGTREWIAYALPEAEDAKGARVYWFDDTPTGGCRLPKAWHVEAQAADGAPWTEVPAKYAFDAATNSAQAEFSAPVKAKAFRLVVDLAPGYSAGLYEWELR